MRIVFESFCRVIYVNIDEGFLLLFLDMYDLFIQTYLNDV